MKAKSVQARYENSPDVWTHDELRVQRDKLDRIVALVALHERNCPQQD